MTIKQKVPRIFEEPFITLNLGAVYYLLTL